MAQAPFNLAIQRIADALGRLLPPQRAARFMSPFTLIDVPADTLRGASGSGEVTGYTAIGLDTSLLPGVVTSRIIFGTSPMRINGGASADLGATNITVTIEPATTLAPGSMSAADKAKIDTLAAGSVAPTPDTVLIRGPAGEGKCTSFIGGEMDVDLSALDVVGGDAYDVLINAGDTPSADRGGSVRLNAGTTSGGTRGTITLHVPFQTPVTGNVLFFDGTNNFLTANATAVQTAMFADRDLALSGQPSLILQGGLGGTRSRIVVTDAQPIIFEVGGAEVARFDAGGPPAPQSVGAANAKGVSTELSLADHVHAWAGQVELGASTITGTTTTRYLATGYESGTASANALDMPVAKAFSINAIRMFARLGGTAGETITARVRKNGATAGTALVTASDATSGAVTFLSPVSYAPGDTWGLQIDKSGAIATSPTDIFWSVGITP